MAELSLYWHDYETWGADPSRDRAAQFAGIRTDPELNIIGEPLVIYCQPGPDVLPHPDACLITGITPQKAYAEGLPEYEFIRRIHHELARPGTCGVGYNSIRFDDEVTRYTLYRNFYDPYAREWQYGNSRWDIIDMVRLTYALRPEGISWPMGPEGQPSFRLEQLTQSNGIAHEAAHDALSDVYASIALARLIRQKQPKLYDYVFRYRDKKLLAELLDLRQPKPVLHVSSMFPAKQGCTSLVLPLARHPGNSNGIIAYDLTHQPQDLLELDVEAIRERLFVRRDELAEGVERIPLKTIHLNKCPVLATPKLLDEAAAERLGIDVQSCFSHWKQIVNERGEVGELATRVAQVFADREFAAITDPDRMLYSGGFASPHDKAVFEELRRADGPSLASQNFVFEDSRYSELLFRYRARNFPQHLNEQEQQQWREYCQQKVTDPNSDAGIDLAAYQARIDELLEAGDLSDAQQDVLYQLLDWGDALLA